MKQYYSSRSTTARAALAFCCAVTLICATPTYANNFGQDSAANNQSGWTRLVDELVKWIMCTIEQYNVGSEPLEHVASYTRHKKAGVCRTHVGAVVNECDAHTCPDHADAQVRRLLDQCSRAVTYHLPTGEISVVEADPIAGKRERLRGGPYVKRITQKPLVQYAELYTKQPSETVSPACQYVQLLDSCGRVLMIVQCSTPLKKVATNLGPAYELDEHILNKARQDVDINNVKTAVEIF